MSIFCQIKQSLIQQLEQTSRTADWQVLRAEMALTPSHSADGLSWLKGQCAYPRFFWQHRDHPTTLFSVGVAGEFHSLAEAEAFSQQSGLPLVGGITFEGVVRLLLPRLLWTKSSEKLTACLALRGTEIDAVRQFLADCLPPAPLEALNHPPATRQAAHDFASWSANVQQAITAIQTQRFHKVVLANATRLTFTQPLCAYDLLAASRQQNTGCFHFLWAESPDSQFIGSSPERLYRRQGRTFLTEALAGTVAVSDDPKQTEQNADWLRHDPKNRDENSLVVEDICSHLADCATTIEVGDAQIKRLRKVQHLRREIRATLAEQVDDGDCLARIHPTAAVAGLPRQAAMDFIREQEGFSRGWYAGTLGYMQPQRAEFCVTLRCAWIQANQMTIYAGAGIVAASNPEAEWREIERKALAMADLVTQPAST